MLQIELIWHMIWHTTIMVTITMVTMVMVMVTLDMVVMVHHRPGKWWLFTSNLRVLLHPHAFLQWSYTSRVHRNLVILWEHNHLLL
jgi:hypothetical protein